MGTTFRAAGWLAVVALLGAALVAPAVVSASDPVPATVTGHEAHDPDDKTNDPDYWEEKYDLESCSKIDDPRANHEPIKTYVLDMDYALVVVKAGSGEFANTLFGDASAGEFVWSDDDGNSQYDGNEKNISHIIFCDAQEQEETPTPTPTDEPEPTPTPTDKPDPTPTPTGDVQEETGTPEEDVTPPSTDTLVATGSSPSNTSWQLVLVATAALLATALILTPAQRRNRK